MPQLPAYGLPGLPAEGDGVGMIPDQRAQVHIGGTPAVRLHLRTHLLQQLEESFHLFPAASHVGV
jgi:hypothetical protein